MTIIRNAGDRQRLSTWLETALHMSGTSQTELGRRVGLDRRQVHRLISGERRWDVGTAKRIAEALGAPLPSGIQDNRET